MQIGERIRSKRRPLGIKQADIAQRLKVQQSMVSRWENGQTPVPSDVLPHLAKMLDVSVEWLVMGRTR